MRTRIVIVIGLWITLHLYVGSRLLTLGTIGDAWRALGWIAIATLALAPFAAFFASRAERFVGRRVLEPAGFAAMGLSSLLIVFVAVGEVVGLRAWLGAEAFAVTVVGVALFIFVAGTWHARRPSVVRVDVPIADLHTDLEGFRIVQLSDLHVGPTLGRDFVERIVETANELDPHVIALTGDVADGYPSNMRDELAPLASLAAPHGKFFVTGNHEYYWDAPGWLSEVERLGLSALINAHRVIERGAARLILAGVTDISASHRVPGHESDPKTSIAGAPEAHVRILLAHQPRSAYAARQAGFDLQISGHTHGGQYFPFNLLVRFFQPFVAGLHRLETMWLYVSRGTGYWGPPLRLGAPAEITLLTLKRAND